MTITVSICSHGANGLTHLSVPHIELRSAITASNWRQVADKKHLSAIVIDSDTNRVVQATGYSWDRGLFCDMYA